MASVRRAEVSGPVATTPGDGSPAASSCTTVMFGMRRHPLVHRLREDLPVHREGSAARHARQVGARQQQAADQVPHLPRPVLAAELHHRVRLAAGARIGQADRLHRAEAERLPAAPGHLLDRQAALEVGHLVELVALVLVGLDQRVEERARIRPRPSAR